MIRKAAAVLVALVLMSQHAAWAGVKQLQVAWEELGPLVVDKKVSVTLPDGTRLEGEALAVRPEALLLDVHKTSNKKLHPKGQMEVPRTSVTEVRVIRYAGPAMRILCGVLGGFGGGFGAGALGFVTNSAAVLAPAILIGIPVAATAGYYAGKLADRRITRLEVHNGTLAVPTEEGYVQ